MRVCAAQIAGTGLKFSRGAHRVGLATCLILGAFGLQQAGAAAPGDTRTISLRHVHTDESLTITYKRDGQYDEEALNKINWILRDWRKGQAIKMDPQEIDLLWQLYQEVGAKEPINIICGYRSPATNEMLRSRSRKSGVARFSQHTLGKAIDFYIPGVPLDVLRATAMKLQGGGVGYYPTSGSPFVHLDVGNVRAWPRMTREQLVKLFPDGRTVHLASDGSQLPGYQLALADVERNHRSAAQPQKRNFLASLFSREKDAEEADDNTSARESAAATRKASKPQSAPSRVQLAAAAPAPAMAATAQPTLVNVPLPPRRPIFQISAADSRPAPAASPAASIDVAAASPTNIVSSRGFWSIADMTAAAQGDAAAKDASATPRVTANLIADANQDVTATVGPFNVQDRVPTELALAYAVQPDPTVGSAPRQGDRVAATVTTTGSGSIASKPVETVTSAPSRSLDNVDDPWLRGLILTDSAQNSLVVSRVGDADVTTLAEFMQKPASAVVITFSSDPHLGMTTDEFAGSAVVFLSTVTFGPRDNRTASLRR